MTPPPDAPQGPRPEGSLPEGPLPEAIPHPESPLYDASADMTEAEPAHLAELDAAVLGDPDDLIMVGHKYDGIREYDNPMPGWWTAIFLLTVLFVPVYVLGIHVFGYVDTYEEDLAEGLGELAAIREAYASTGPSFKTDPGALREYAADPLFAAAGAETYGTTCASCHGAEGQGGIGPNLTDAYWKHGGAPEDIYRVIHEGIVTNGMPAWDGVLTEEEQAQAMAFVRSLQGTSPPDPKAPEGELYTGL